jgi:tetratricopeptide (TPR) repeat protein
MRRLALGPDHHKFAEDLACLAAVLAGRGKLGEARELLEQALVIRRESLGDDHPVTAVTKHQLATVLRRLGERDQAERLYREAAGSLSRRFGPENGWAIAASEDLGRLLDGREPKERDWLSGTRLPLPVALPRERAMALTR